MTSLRRSSIRKPLLIVSFVILYALLYAAPAFSAALTTASLTLSDPRTGQASTYTADAASFSTGVGIACVQLDLGANADGTGAVAGLDTSSSTFVSSSLVTAGSWSVDNTGSANHELAITHNTATENPVATGNVVWGNVTNGSAENVTYYGVLTTYTNTNCTTGPTDAATLTFVYKDGELVSLTIDPSLTFSCAGVATATDIYPVGGASLNTTVLSDASGIDHASTVNSTTNGISAHDLTTTTNASGGFNVYVRHTGLLTNVASDTIGTGSLSAAAFPAPGTEAWAWTTDDDDVGTYNNAGSGLWESFTTSNTLIATEAGVASTTDRVGHQVGVSGTTPAGTYTTTIVYTAVAIY